MSCASFYLSLPRKRRKKKCAEKSVVVFFIGYIKPGQMIVLFLRLLANTPHPIFEDKFT